MSLRHPTVDRLERGQRGEIAETPKPDDPVFRHVTNTVIGNNRLVVDAAADEAVRLGYGPHVLTRSLEGEARLADGTLDFYPPRKAGNTHYSQERRAGAVASPIRGRVNCLTTIMRRLGHRHIDVLKLDVEGSEFEVIPDLIDSGISIDAKPKP